MALTTLVHTLFLVKGKRENFTERFFCLPIFASWECSSPFPYRVCPVFHYFFPLCFLFASYWFICYKLKYVPLRFKKRFSWRLIKTSLYYLFISSLGPWAVGGVMATLGTDTIWYLLAIYFYLHFQYNGWFILALFGVLFYIFEGAGLQFPQKKYHYFMFF